MTREELARKITAVARLSGEFRLRSGQVSDTYFDKYRFEADPSLLREVARQMAPLVPSDTEILAGLELGGVPVATTLSLETGLPTCFVRKARKDYGTCRIAEGAEIRGRRVCVIEDVITTGGQVLSSVADLRADGAEVATVCCVILRASGVPSAFEDDGLALNCLFSAEDLTE